MKKRLIVIVCMLFVLSGCTNKEIEEQINSETHYDNFQKIHKISSKDDSDNSKEKTEDNKKIDITDIINEGHQNSGYDRDITYGDAQYKDDTNENNEEANIDLSMFKTESSKNVMIQLLNDNNTNQFEMFKAYFGEYSNDIETNIYYITMDKKTVYYIYEQGDSSYALKDENFSYDEVIEILEQEASRYEE